MNGTNNTTSTNVITIDVSILEARLVLALTCCVIVTITVIGGYMTSIHKAPPFVRILVILIGVGNVAGVCFSISMMHHDIYDSGWTFAWQFTCMAIYWCSEILTYWIFAYQYLLTSRSLEAEMEKILDHASMND